MFHQRYSKAFLILQRVSGQYFFQFLSFFFIFYFLLFIVFMHCDKYFNQIQLSSVNEVSHHFLDPNNESIINELNMLDSQPSNQPKVTKIQSFIYAENIIQDIERPTPLELRQGQEEEQYLGVDSFRLGRKDIRFENEGEENHNTRSKRKRKEDDSPQEKKSIREQLIEENKILERRLKYNNKFRETLSSHHFKVEKGLKPVLSNKNIHPSKPDLSPQSLNKVYPNFALTLQKLQSQYTQSNVIKLYNFIKKEFPKCQKCQHICEYLVQVPQGLKITCRQCSKGHPFYSLFGVLYDLQNKSRFEEELNSYQSILESINQEIQNFKKQISDLESLKEKIVLLKNLNRKRYKQINQSKFHLKKHLSDFKTSHLSALERLIPKEYLEQMNLWGEVDLKFKNSWKGLYQHVYKLMPLYIHDHTESKVLSALHKLLNYQDEQSVKISVSQHIKFPLKKMQNVVLVVDGSYNLPIFDNVNHLQLQFQNKKTMRELSLLFDNFPRYIYSLKLTYDHKLHSHISAETFPFLKNISALSSIKKLDITINNTKDFSDVYRLSNELSDKKDVKLKITKHLFSQQQLILPQQFYNKLVSNLGPELVRFEIQLPESIDSQANLDFDALISQHKLCFFRVSRGEKDKPHRKHAKVLEQLDQNQKSSLQKKESIFKGLLFSRLRLIFMIKTFNLPPQKAKILIDSVSTLLL